MKALGVVLIAAAVLGSVPADGAAQADLSGAWDVTVITDQGEQMLTVQVVQSGQDLTATGDAGQLGTIDMTGTVDGDRVRLAWELDLQGTPLQIVLLGTLADGAISGTADFGGMGRGDWRAERADD
jgi:hypothetical protein